MDGKYGKSNLRTKFTKQTSEDVGQTLYKELNVAMDEYKWSHSTILISGLRKKNSNTKTIFNYSVL